MTGPRDRRRRLADGPLPALAAAFLARVAAGFAFNAGASGPRGFAFYGSMADGALSERGLGWDFYMDLGWKAANRAPLYPLFLAAVRWFAGSPGTVATILAQAALGAVSCLVPALIARRWAGDRAFRASLWLAALWPYSLLVDTGMVEHVVFTPLALLSALAVLRAQDTGSLRGAALAGASAGLAALGRITFVPTIALFAAALLLRRGVRPALALVVGAAAVLSLWVVRNHAATGEYVLGTDGGRALWVGNDPGTFRHYPAGSIDDAERDMLLALGPARLAELRALGEVAQDRRFREMALANVAADPGAVAWGAVRKAGALWSPVYNPAPIPPDRRTAGGPWAEFGAPAWSVVARYAIHGVTFVLLLAAAAAGAAAVPRVRADLPVLLLLLLSFTAVAAAFWGQPRYLAPLHGLGLALAAAGWAGRKAGERSA